MIDLRSDTVTRPSAAMRRAMAEAEVGDDVYGEDPTTNRLQEQVAELLGADAALFVPTGSMANQIALMVNTQPGDEVIVGRGSHSQLFESGATPVLAGVQLQVMDGDGRFTAAQVRAGFRADNHLQAPTRLVMVENTHNLGGGLVWPAAQLAEVQAAARELGLALHLDGARLWNAAVASGRSERDLARGFDTISVALSKGLGAPIGSLLAGRKDLVHRGHRMRKLLGGGMRQVGILAAAGLHALEHNRARLVDDHESARYLADELAGLPGLALDPTRVDTNIVVAEVGGGLDAAQLAQAARERGLLFGVFGTPGTMRIRLVTHLDVSRQDCTRAVEILAGLCR